MLDLCTSSWKVCARSRDILQALRAVCKRTSKVPGITQRLDLATSSIFFPMNTVLMWFRKSRCFSNDCCCVSPTFGQQLEKSWSRPPVAMRSRRAAGEVATVPGSRKDLTPGNWKGEARTPSMRQTLAYHYITPNAQVPGMYHAYTYYSCVYTRCRCTPKHGETSE